MGFFRGAKGVMLVFDLCRLDSFHNIKSWLADVAAHAGPDVAVVLVGNKVDLADAGERQVPTAAAEAAWWSR